MIRMAFSCLLANVVASGIRFLVEPWPLLNYFLVTTSVIYSRYVGRGLKYVDLDMTGELQFLEDSVWDAMLQPRLHLQHGSPKSYHSSNLAVGYHCSVGVVLMSSHRIFPFQHGKACLPCADKQGEAQHIQLPRNYSLVTNCFVLIAWMLMLSVGVDSILESAWYDASVLLAAVVRNVDSRTNVQYSTYDMS
ncbi:hypothetical protein F4859DRAFT_202302 [Xylaria cf. heliscus]|nr:hypothetical protein F4859DRAFT_202302 [Xylaria cf. heliscus]